MKLNSIVTAASALLLSVPAVFAQQGTAYPAQDGKGITLSTEYEASFIYPYEKIKGQAIQGADYYKGYVLSLRNTGVATILKYEDGKLTPVSNFKLASYHKNNHANVASFGKKYDRKDPLPLAYVSHCQKALIDGKKDLLFVERISEDMKSSTLVQTIFYDDVNKDFDYALQWVVDGKYLYGFGNTTKDRDLQGNRHRVIKFLLPDIDQKFVTLRPEDALENYCIEDSGFTYGTIGQGLCIHKGHLLMPSGLGDANYPSYLWVWNLKTRRMDSVLDLGAKTKGEPEDLMRVKGNHYLLQGQLGVFTLDYKIKKTL